LSINNFINIKPPFLDLPLVSWSTGPGVIEWNWTIGTLASLTAWDQLGDNSQASLVFLYESDDMPNVWQCVVNPHSIAAFFQPTWSLLKPLVLGASPFPQLTDIQIFHLPSP
jgi:hypothetical protein